MAAAFPTVDKIRYAGPESRDPLAFKWYNEDEVIEGKTMKDHLRFSVVYWHTFRGNGSDPFGAATMDRPWDDGSDSVENAQHRVRVAFEFMEKLGAPYYAFHDRDVALQLQFIPVDHLRWQVVGFWIKAHFEGVRDAEPAAADFAELFTGGSGDSGFNIVLGHRSFLRFSERPAPSGRSWEYTTALHTARRRMIIVKFY